MSLWLSLLSSLVILATSVYGLVITEVGPPEGKALTSREQRLVLPRSQAGLREACRKYAGTQGKCGPGFLLYCKGFCTPPHVLALACYSFAVCAFPKLK